jgi:hypothetical protein
MATAASLNCVSTIASGNGLAINPALLSAITEFQAHTTVTSIKDVYNYSNLSQVTTEINKLGVGVTQGLWIIDYYPPGVTPVSSRPIVAWQPDTNYSVGTIVTNGGRAYTVTGNANAGNFDNVVSSVSLTGASEIVEMQAQLAFGSGGADGMAIFANAVSTAQGYASSSFDTVASVYLLENKTYGQSGLKYTGLTDLVTGGIGNNATLLGNVVNGWGTMYNITNINLISDPYVFGQNLLNQGLGSVGNLADQLTAVGLDIEDITKIPATSTTVDQQSSTITSQTSIGEIELPFTANVVSTNTVTGNSPTVVVDIYKTITGANLASIVSATGFVTNSNITTLADLLNFAKVVPATPLAQLNALGITTFTGFTDYLNSRVGQGNFTTWKALGNFLKTIEIPAIPRITTTSSTPVLNSSTVTSLRGSIGTGSGPFGNPIMADYFGITAGMNGFTETFTLLNTNYSSVSSISVLISNLAADVRTYTDEYNAWLGTAIPESSPGAGDGIPPTGSEPSLSTIIDTVTAINNALNSSNLPTCDTAWAQMLTRMTSTVNNLATAGVTFGTAPTSILIGFGQRVPQLAAEDLSGIEMDKLMANLITDDVHGDTIRAAVSEQNNTNILSIAGITLNNDPNPRQVLSKAKAQNVSISTYLSQNK